MSEKQRVVSDAESVIPVYLDEEPIVPPGEPPIAEPTVSGLRKDAYREDADPLFFAWQALEASEATRQEREAAKASWLAARQAVKGRYPKEAADGTR